MARVMQSPDEIDGPAPSSDSGGGAARRWCLGLVLAAGALIRALHADQPIVENYVGRQTPTAMVAANLERGSGFLYPQLDTAPFPNYFLVEPPLYQELVVGLRALTGLPLEVCGRLVSALAATLAAWGVYALMEPREGWRAAIAASAVFSMLPITLRYGRAFQPDALMIGACAAGLACWDLAGRRVGGRGWLLAGWLLLAVGVAAKATAAFILPVAFLTIGPKRTRSAAVLLALTLAPVAGWYLWANHLASTSTGSRAAMDNRDIWIRLIGLGSLASRETWTHIGHFLLFRAFTPLGPLVAIWGLWPRRGDGDGRSLWRVWGVLGLTTMALLGAKLRHEYYWLCLAPVVAAGLGIAWSRIDARRPVIALVLTSAFAALCLALSISTWRTPPEWENLDEASRSASLNAPGDDWLVAPEPLLLRANRRGCRLEFTDKAAERAALEWGPDGGAVKTPLDLVEFYRTRGARWLADVGAGAGDAPRMALHAEIRRRYKVVVDRPEVFLAKLISNEPRGHGHRSSTRHDSRFRRLETERPEDFGPHRLRVLDRQIARSGRGGLPARGRLHGDRRAGPRDDAERHARPDRLPRRDGRPSRSKSPRGGGSAVSLVSRLAPACHPVGRPYFQGNAVPGREA